MTSIAITLGSAHVHRAIAPRTIFFSVDLHAALGQFADPDTLVQALAGSGFEGRDDDEILVGRVGFAVSFCRPIAAGDLGRHPDAPDFAEAFNDRANFEIRVPALASTVSAYFHRMEAPLADMSACGLAVLESISVAPGFEAWDVLDGALRHLSLLLNGEAGLLFVHSELDRLKSEGEVWRAISRMEAFRKAHPEWRVTTFREIGPLAGSMAGFVPPALDWPHGDEWIRVTCDYGILDDDLEDAEGRDNADPGESSGGRGGGSVSLRGDSQGSFSISF